MAHLHKPARMPAAEIAAALERRDLGAFTELLTLMVGAEPTAEAYQALADRDPLRWAQAIAMLAPLAGY
jgi:hypothetical protein